MARRNVTGLIKMPQDADPTALYQLRISELENHSTITLFVLPHRSRLRHRDGDSRMTSLVTRRDIGRRFWGMAASGLGVAAAHRVADAASLPQPVEKPVLTVSGKISVANKDGVAQFDRPMLEALGMSGFETATPWYERPVRFDGVGMARLMQAVGAWGERLLPYALNDYSTELPVWDFARHDVILALKRDGQYMSVRDKGPLFIVYPFDSDPALRHQRYYSRSAWQLARLVVA